MECNNLDIKEIDINSNNENRLIGLTDKEVELRIKNGQVNKLPTAPSRTIWQMIRANFFNIFNALNIVLAGIVIIAGSPKNAIFAGVILVNSIIGVMQELNAKKTLEKLSVLSMANAKVLRNGKEKVVSIEELVIDDIVCLSSGDQILADCKLVKGDELEVDESMLTGEADPVPKKSSDEVLSGSFVVAGEGFAKITKVGGKTYSSKLADEARKFKIVNSELQTSISKIIKMLLFLIVPLGIILTTTQIFFSRAGWRESLIGVVSGIVGMIPEGLVLLTSATFIVSVVRLAKYDALVQQLSATELLARVDVLCVDKTGTITEGKLKLVDVKPVHGVKKELVDEVLAALVHNLPSKNPTQKAILEHYDYDPSVSVLEKVPFSSRRKWGGIILKSYGTWVLGAPEILLGDRYSSFSSVVEAEAIKGRRVLLLGKVNQISLKKGILESVEEAAFILIEDVIKEEAPEVLKFFNKEGVTLKVISGDNPVTVSAVAMRAGVEGADRYVDARSLPIEIEELVKVIDDYTIFGRVTPHQKKDIIKALQLKGHTVAMTGDGVNDVLALKEADCGIAMGNGSEATKAVAQLVLLNSDFGALPKVVTEGRKQINNLERVAELFLTKTVFFVSLSLIICLILLPYPLSPIQASLVGSCAIGIPSFFLALEPSVGRVKKGFLRRILTKSIPNGVIMVLFTVSAFAISHLSGVGLRHSRSVALIVFLGISLVVLLRVALPLTRFKLFLLIAMVVSSIICYVTPIGRWVFSLTPITIGEWIMAIVFIALSWPMLSVSVGFARRVKSKRKVQVV
ncbi:cation-translocating P-type ATPase [Clostridium sp. SHJSY1]|uniref:cation-translocating P-type ATPase n=1 Tax=Clostridium sp. SHJSY1 TaxID=2942483 RepID=UPI0028754E78|nr:HAD-IC family P-type ATPase [Clostridium sp. SHJSY1]MDS0528549.1 cation-translocating P-type ATPase [Clostridium sp. SHJSY1]